jgi:hypothetical protein
MKTNLKKGAIDLAVLLVIALGAVILYPNSKIAQAIRGKEAKAVDVAVVKVEKAQDRVDDKTKEVIHSSHIEMLKTEVALQSAPPSQPVEVAQRTSSNANALIGQIDTVTVKEMQELMALVKDLISQDRAKLDAAELKQKQAEANYSKLGEEMAKVKGELDKRNSELDAKQADLRAAYDREAALADKYRKLRSWAIGIVVVAILAFIGVLYFRLKFTGLRAGLSKSLADGDMAGIGNQLRSALDPNLNRDEQIKLKQLAQVELAKILAAKKTP